MCLGEGCWFTKKSGKHREAGCRWVGHGQADLAQHSVCMTLSQSQWLTLELQGDPEPGQQEG